MTIGRFISIASLLGALSIVGCGDNDVCDNCDVQERKDDCKDFLKNCDGPDCPEQALVLCSVL